MELFDVIDSKGNPAGQIVSRKKPMQKESPIEQPTYGLFGKRKAECRFFYRNATQNKDSFPGKFDTSRQDTSRQETNHWNLHFGN